GRNACAGKAPALSHGGLAPGSMGLGEATCFPTCVLNLAADTSSIRRASCPADSLRSSPGEGLFEGPALVSAGCGLTPALSAPAGDDGRGNPGWPLLGASGAARGLDSSEASQSGVRGGV